MNVSEDEVRDLNAPPPPFRVIVGANATDAATAMRLVRQAKTVFPFLPGAVYDKAIQNSELFLCLHGDDPVGALHFHHRRDRTTTVHELIVAPSCRGRGVGRLLLDALARAAGERGQTRLRLKCPENEPANGFYSRVGFRRTGMEQSRTRHVAVWERPVTVAEGGEDDLKPGWQFYASLTAPASDIRRLVRKYYEGYAAWGQEPPFHPFRRLIFTPLFSSPATIELFRELAKASPDPLVTRLGDIRLPRPTVICDSGGYQVQMGKMTFDELTSRLRGLYAEQDWADYYVLPDHVPHSTDSDAQVAVKVDETFAAGELFLARLPERRQKFLGVVHGRTEKQMREGAKRWADLGVGYIGFGSFGTGGPDGSVNLVSHKSVALLSELSGAAKANRQKIHVFGIGNAGYLKKFAVKGVAIESFDSAGWWKMAGFGYVLQQDRFDNLCSKGRMTKTLAEIEESFLVSGHRCPFCNDVMSLRLKRWDRIMHNLSCYGEIAMRNYNVM